MLHQASGTIHKRDPCWQSLMYIHLPGLAASEEKEGSRVFGTLKSPMHQANVSCAHGAVLQVAHGGHGGSAPEKEGDAGLPSHGLGK